MTWHIRDWSAEKASSYVLFDREPISKHNCSSLEADDFIKVLVCFMSRRGIPKLVRSDNGKNFVGAKKELKLTLQSWNLNQVEEFLKQGEIVWKFNPPYASHMGGAWER